ncbi:MAG TPA: peptide chain release factor 2 [Thermotogota bacterium]|nr:peptide chain release factor 2 [Thermotogota bacterium]HRW92440.1 peptide chain release factor 2 [Thermotogota bacterium]
MLTYDQKAAFSEICQKFQEMSGVFDPEWAKQRLLSLEKTMSQSDFWEDPDAAADTLKESKMLQTRLEERKQILDLIQDGEVALELAEEDESMEKAFHDYSSRLRKAVRKFELSMLLNDRFDMNNAFLTIHPGAGGTESQDWSQMLMRMYLRWAERKNFEVEIIELQPGEEAGIKDATLLLKGEYVYGYTKFEQGIHRLVRISPFDSNKRRHTSFASVSVLPELDQQVDIDINPDDLKIDVYRASGAGGQHVNRTESAVRITHLPSGIVVTCQNQRNQHQNKDTAMKILTARLYQLELEKKKREQQAIQGDLTDISWGNQIRSYVFQPYKMIKDLRTQTETGNVDAVMDGDIDPFIESELVFFSKREQGE